MHCVCPPVPYVLARFTQQLRMCHYIPRDCLFVLLFILAFLIDIYDIPYILNDCLVTQHDMAILE